jgi:hypothetical protein
VESEEIGELWYNHIYHGKQPDPHLKRHPFHILDPANLRLSIGPETSIVVRDKKTNEIILVVMRNACRDDGAVLSVDATVIDATKQKKSIRVSELIDFLCLIANPK